MQENCLNQNSQNSRNFCNGIMDDGLTYKVIYQRSLAIELADAHLDFKREVEQVVYYKNIEVGIRRADFIIGNKIIVELKALIGLDLEAYNFPIGLLINFGSKSLEYKLIFNKKYHSVNPVNSVNSGSDNCCGG